MDTLDDEIKRAGTFTNFKQWITKWDYFLRTSFLNG